MSKPLLGEKIAVLVANGFAEKDLTSTQKDLLAQGANVRIVSMDGGLVNSWDTVGWGLNFAVDQVLSEALAVDYTMLLVPGGQRSIDKLKLTAHTRRFLNGFLNAGKPVALLGEAAGLLNFVERAEGVHVSAEGAVATELAEVGAVVSGEASSVNGALVTALNNDEALPVTAAQVIEFFIGKGEEIAAQAVAA